MEIRKVIERATLDLLKDTHVDQLSITEIAKKAYISRVTFYNHFENKYEVIESIFCNLIIRFDEIQKKNSNYLFEIDLSNVEEIKQKLYPNTLEILEYFYSEKGTITILLSDKSGMDFMERLYEVYFKHFKTALPDLYYFKFTSIALDQYAVFMTKGVTAIVENWFYTKFNSSPEFIANSILNMLAFALNDLYCSNLVNIEK
ncbi:MULTISPECIES: TetR/AcrR family transcriptional regulator [unclassified Enterococcus]|uniref:TetR/AcrR family transcriptional regulator n=1 Tax=unclassified Enterococcus TaxID=2608891 RepID=UPI001CE21B4C|nr:MULTISPECIES: TetR/AcrR family transcriptional regulator [unclassified Enterococcus]MCA5011466.1 TetR/AcrR family transcriptional regulator [Enterococcus sp. S23]MCA5015092.1 TetR/AcrR family transcriptional regulator [Enterococcus sp. S22(2020)]